MNLRDPKKAFGITLKELREKSGMSQEEFGKRLGKKTTTVSSWENGQCYPVIPTYFEICKLCNCSPDIFSPIFFPKEQPKQPHDLILKSRKVELKTTSSKYSQKVASTQKDEEIIIAKYRLLNDRQKQYVKALVNSMIETELEK